MPHFSPNFREVGRSKIDSKLRREASVLKGRGFKLRRSLVNSKVALAADALLKGQKDFFHRFLHILLTAIAFV